MKPAQRTIKYIVYSPNYVPGKGTWEIIENFKKAKKKAVSLGVGSEIVREIYRKNRKGYGSWRTIRGYIYGGKNEFMY